MLFLIRNNKIFELQELPVLDKDVIMIEATDEQVNNVNEYGLIYYTYKNKKVVENPDYEKEKEEERKEYINSLSCTKRVLALAIKEFGITYTQLKTLIDSDEDAQLEWDLCVELQRSNPLLDQFGDKLGITPEQIDNIFLYANGDIESLGA